MPLVLGRSTVFSSTTLYKQICQASAVHRSCDPILSVTAGLPRWPLTAGSGYNAKQARQQLASVPLRLIARCCMAIDATGTEAITAGMHPQQLGASPTPVVPEEPCSSAYRVVNFYHLVDIENPFKVIAEHKAWAADKDLCGRIYLSTQGINAQYSGLTDNAEGYAKWLEQQQLFKGLRWSSFPVSSHQFPKLRLKFKQNLISLSGGMTRLPITNPQARATPLAPGEWKAMLAKTQQLKPPQSNRQQLAANQTGRHSESGAQLRDDATDVPSATAGTQAATAGAEAAAPQEPAVIVLDVRNDYEWDAGHFSGAGRPQEENFNQTPSEESSSDSIPSYLQGADPDTPVMMYCTGGIRCDVYSAHLRDKGFTNLYTLEGGVQNYLRQEGHAMWDGSLFVFDGRMAVPSGNPAHGDELVAAAPCAACGHTATLPHMNCANIDCNKLFLACDQHKEEFAGCCCQKCMDAPRLLRPAKQTGYYGNWSTYSSDDEGTKLRLVEGRGDGRLARRQKRLEKMRAKEAVAREQRHARKELVKVAMRNRQAALEVEATAQHADDLALKLTQQIAT